MRAGRPPVRSVVSCASGIGVTSGIGQARRTRTCALTSTVAPSKVTVRSMRADSSSTAPTLATMRHVGAGLGVDDDRAGEPHAVVEDAADVAEPRHDRLDGEAHRQHAVREHAGKADGGGDVVAVVDRVEVPRCPGVAHEGLPGQVHGALGDDVADGRARSCVPLPHERGPTSR